MNDNGTYRILKKQFPTAQSVVSEIINLKAILNLPKGTEHFLSDIHGESVTFSHILRNASGVIRTKIDLAFGDRMSEGEKNKFAALIYYPEQVLKNDDSTYTSSWYAQTSFATSIRLQMVCAYQEEVYVLSSFFKTCSG